MKLLHPHFIKCEKPKSELNLTFSAMVKVNGEKKISKIQKVVENVIKKQEMLKGIEMEDKPRGLYKRIRRGDRFICKYPSKISSALLAKFNTAEPVI